MAGGIAGSIATGGAAAPWLIPAASAVGQAWEAHDAEKKGAKQIQSGLNQGIGALQPYNARGNAAGDTLAGYLGINVPEGGFAGPQAVSVGGPQTGLGVPGGSLFGYQPGLVAKRAADASNQSQTLSNFLNYSGLDEGDQQVQSMPQGRMLPSSKRSGSSYATREAV